METKIIKTDALENNNKVNSWLSWQWRGQVLCKLKQEIIKDMEICIIHAAFNPWSNLTITLKYRRTPVSADSLSVVSVIHVLPQPKKKLGKLKK